MLDAGRMRFFGFVLGACVFFGFWHIAIRVVGLLPCSDTFCRGFWCQGTTETQRQYVWAERVGHCLLESTVLFCTQTIGKVLDIRSAQIDSKPSTLFGFRPGLEDLRTASCKEDLMTQIQGLMADAARLS